MGPIYSLCTLPDILCCWRFRNNALVVDVGIAYMSVCRPQHTDTWQNLCSVHRYRDYRLLLLMVVLGCRWIGVPSCHLICVTVLANWLRQLGSARDNHGQNHLYLSLSLHIHYLTVILVTDNASVQQQQRPQSAKRFDTLRTNLWEWHQRLRNNARHSKYFFLFTNDVTKTETDK